MSEPEWIKKKIKILLALTFMFSINFPVLPVLRDPPSAENIGTTSLTLIWNVWNSDNGDTGDGPITAYSVYHQLSQTPVSRWSHPIDPSQTQLSAPVSSLNPDTEYHFYVKVERDGPGGEGPAGPTVIVKTKSLTPAIAATDKTATSGAASKG